MNTTQSDFEKKKAQLFKECEEEIKFKPNKANKIEVKLARILKILGIKDVPVVALTPTLFFIGVFKVELKLLGDYVVVRTSSTKWERLSDYIKQNREMFVKALTLLSMHNDNMSIP